MPRGDHRLSIRCADSACRETADYRLSTVAEYNRVRADNRKSPWKCPVHEDPDAYLRPGNEANARALTASRIPHRDPRTGEPIPGEYLSGLYWLEDGASSGPGIASGPGFRALARDWPEGTRLEITARILPPEESESS
jgi:hypothetical protein